MIAEGTKRQVLMRTVARRVECEEDGLYFNRFFFKDRFGDKMIINAHHEIMQATLDRTMLPHKHKDFISRLIITVPPGYTKTEMASIGYMARGLGINPAARFLHLSYSKTLALLNSSTARAIVKSQPYQAMWPIRTKEDTDSKQIWHTTVGGGVTANSIGGQVTGFRAGHMKKYKFTGALIIDDPIKPGDAASEARRGVINDNYGGTVASRLAIETIPIIVIMQRTHYDDLAGFLLRGGSGEKWHHLNLPVIIDNNTPYPEENTHGIPVEHGLPDGWLWPFKHNEDHETALKAHRRKWNAQYLQRPLHEDSANALWDDDMLNLSRALWLANNKMQPSRTVVAVDPAVSNTDESDEHGVVVLSKYDTPNLFSIDADYTQRGSPAQWANVAITAYDKHDADAIVIEVNQGGDMCESTLRNAGFKGRVIRVRATKNKAVRAEPIAALYELKYVMHRPGLGKLEDELIAFDTLTGKSLGDSPNRLDAAVWGLTELSGGEIGLDELLEMAIRQGGG